jgi:chromatin structure-remodeling complex subunit RSC9
LLALRSGISEEEDYALHHLVKISHERGEKYRFEAFPGLAEGLVEKVLEISSLFYDVKWDVSYRDDGPVHEKRSLDGIHGTSDILARLTSLKPLGLGDDMETEEFSHRLSKINEAGLVLRNMAMLEENAEHLSRLHPVRDFINVALNLPPRPSVIELQHYALDIAEQITKYLSLEPEDPLYKSLLTQLKSSDRGIILTTLRAISRISMNLEENNRLKGVPMSIIRRISDWTLIDDEELVNACLDFLYQYTAVDDNVQAMLTEVNIEGLINQLVRLLLHGAKEVETKVLTKKSVKGRSAKEIPNLPRDLLEQLLKYEEPERSGYW